LRKRRDEENREEVGVGFRGDMIISLLCKCVMFVKTHTERTSLHPAHSKIADTKEGGEEEEEAGRKEWIHRSI
jgi:hypothetical protein